MAWEAWLTVVVVAGMVGVLVTTQIAADAAFLGALSVLVIAGVISPEAAFAGLGNQGLVTIAVLYVVVTGLRDTGSIAWVVESALGRPRSLTEAQLKLFAPVTVMSAFLNNTPVVAMLIPAVNDWGRKYAIPASQLMMPLSFAAILGGTCTLIGTSTNLVVNGLLIERTGSGLGMFTVGWVGLPVAVLGLAFMMLASRWLLPDRRPPISTEGDPREYTVEMLVEAGSPLVGRTIEQAGLRHLQGAYLMEIDRNGDVLPAVSPRLPLAAGDRLVFVGVVDSVVELQKIRGLVPATDQVFKLTGPGGSRHLIEAVVSHTCPLVGKSIREGRFRSRYNAAVIAVARNGERVKGKVGDIVLKPGDTLLLQARPAFVEQHRNSRDFYLVSAVEDSEPPRHNRAATALAVLAGMVIAVTFGLLSMLEAALAAAGLMLLTRCCTTASARRSVDWSVLIVIGAAFGLGHALETTGVVTALTENLIGLAGSDPTLNLVLVYLVTAILTLLITNNAAAVIMFPFAASIAADLQVSILPFALAIMMAASASFATPMGYQTNLMVYGPGGYRFTDYLRMGLPMNLLAAAVTLAVIPWMWPLR